MCSDGGLCLSNYRGGKSRGIDEPRFHRQPFARDCSPEGCCGEVLEPSSITLVAPVLPFHLIVLSSSSSRMGLPAQSPIHHPDETFVANSVRAPARTQQPLKPIERSQK